MVQNTIRVQKSLVRSYTYKTLVRLDVKHIFRSPTRFTLINKTQRLINENRLAKLRDVLANDKKITTEHKYYVCLPSCVAHYMCHPTRREDGLLKRVHPAIIQKIHSLVLDDISDPFEVQSHYVHHFLCLSNLPDPLDHAYYPNFQDIRNHINNAKRQKGLKTWSNCTRS